MVLKYGLGSGIGACILLYLSAYASLNKGASFEDYTSLIIMTSFVLILVELRSKLPMVSFATAFKSTFTVSIISIGVSASMFYYILKYYDRNLLDMYKTAFLDLIDQMEFPSHIKQMQKDQVSSYGPAFFTLAFVLGCFMKYLFWSCMVSLFMKKEKAENTDEQY